MPLLMKQTETTHQTGSERQTPPDAMLHTGGHCLMNKFFTYELFCYHMGKDSGCRKKKKGQKMHFG